MEHIHHHHAPSLIILSVLIAIFASYTALDLTNSVSTARGNLKWLWLVGGSLAMGVGIWSMHFIGMLAFSVEGINIYYDVPLLILSIIVAIFASAIALYAVSSMKPSAMTYTLGSSVMGTAIAGMHYIGIASMRMAATIHWNMALVIASILIAFSASCVALFLAFRLREDVTLKGFMYRGAGGVVMGFAIAGMHYTGMAAMMLTPDPSGISINPSDLLATDGLAAAVIVGTMIVLGVALSGSNIERALSRRQVINDALQASIQARDQFFSIASHELKTPLTSIKLQNDLLLKMLKTDDSNKEKIIQNLHKTSKNIERINRLVDDMLDISRMNTGKLHLQKETFNLSELVHDVLEKLQPLIDEAGCQVEIKRDEVVTGEWDRFRLEQVFTNILSNAAKYAAGKPIEISVFRDKNMASVCIRDYGRGIPKKDQEIIFNRFERADYEGTVKGLGLGLFITKEIVNMHDGFINVHSDTNQGAEFQVCLPV